MRVLTFISWSFVPLEPWCGVYKVQQVLFCFQVSETQGMVFF